jgi:hypothetical protein
MVRFHQSGLFVRIEPGKQIENLTSVGGPEVTKCVSDNLICPQRAGIGRCLEKNAEFLAGYGFEFGDVVVSTLGNKSDGSLAQRPNAI